jgi:shikimate dehydrogenase
MSLNLGILGYPIKDSLSPLLHSMFIASTGINGGYNAFPVQDGMSLPVVINFLERFGFTGLNVTTPHKETIVPLAAEHSETVRRLGAANTLHYGKDGWVAYNTDVHGFASLLDYYSTEPAGARVLLLGAGGGAKAALMALEQKGARDIVVVNRNEVHVNRVKESFKRLNITYSSFETLKNKGSFDIVINALPVDWSNDIWRGRFWPSNEEMLDQKNVRVAIDLRYLPQQKDFLGLWDESVKTYNGLYMLTEQAAASFEIWTSVRPEYSFEEFERKVSNV